MWVHRLLLELRNHSAAWFVTLTYGEHFLPGDGKVSKRHAQLFLKRLRKAVGTQIRYYLVAEYGEVGGRPHYHAILFGGPEDLAQASMWVSEAWGLGFVHVGSVTAASCAYTLGYMMKAKDGFVLMSRKPGLGCGRVLDAVARFYRSSTGRAQLAKSLDVSEVLRTEGQVLPLGRYLRRKIRLAVGLDAGEPPARARARARQAVLEGPVAPGVREQHAAIAKKRLEIESSKRVMR
jgi:hypothetical protein